MDRISEAFVAVAELGFALGLRDIAKLDGCWEYQIDERWWIALNAHDQPVACSTGAEVEPFSIYVEFNGWPAGIFSAQGGVIAAGEAANEEAFLAALRAKRASLNV